MNHWAKAISVALVVVGSSCADRNRSAPVHDAKLPPEASGIDAPVVLLTIDGVRWQEVFEGTDPALARGPHVPASVLMPNLYALGSERGAFVGAPGFGVIAATGPEYVSLPGYNEIFTGSALHGCRDNECPRTRLPTLLDEARMQGGKVAAFASWTKIDLALTTTPGSFMSASGPMGASGVDGQPGLDDSRSDHDTAEAAIAYFEAQRPDVFYLGLGEPDERAHEGDYEGYLAAIRHADSVLGRLLAILELDARGRRTHVVVTPDHGRSKNFRSHGGVAPEAARVWTVIGGPRVVARGFVSSPRERHLSDITPTLRLFLGLPSDGSPGSGAPLDEVLSTTEAHASR